MLIITEDTLKRHPKRRDETDKQYAKRVAQINASHKYNSKNTVQKKVSLNVKTDSRLIDAWEYIPEIFGETRSSHFKAWLSQIYDEYEDVIKELKNKDLERGKKK
jgi:hypothetical protein